MAAVFAVHLIRLFDRTLTDAGSGAMFTPVTGMTLDFPLGLTRNPMYSGLVFVAVPALTALLYLLNTQRWLVTVSQYRDQPRARMRIGV